MDKTKAYAFYVEEADKAEAQDVLREVFDCRRHHDIISYLGYEECGGILLVFEGYVNNSDESGGYEYTHNDGWWVERCRYHDGHLEEGFSNIVHMDWKQLVDFKPQTKCQVHELHYWQTPVEREV